MSRLGQHRHISRRLSERVSDILRIAGTVIRAASWKDSKANYSATYVPQGSDTSNTATVTLTMVRRQGDDGGFVVSIMLPDES